MLPQLRRLPQPLPHNLSFYPTYHNCIPHHIPSFYLTYHYYHNPYHSYHTHPIFLPHLPPLPQPPPQLPHTCHHSTSPTTTTTTPNTHIPSFYLTYHHYHNPHHSYHTHPIILPPLPQPLPQLTHTSHHSTSPTTTTTTPTTATTHMPSFYLTYHHYHNPYHSYHNPHHSYHTHAIILPRLPRLPQAKINIIPGLTRGDLWLLLYFRGLHFLSPASLLFLTHFSPFPALPHSIQFASLHTVSGNDLFLRNGETGNTEEIILDAMYMVDELKRFNRAAIIGILPRLGASPHALSKAIGVNERLEDMCTPLGVRFVDPYNVFYGRADLYLPDGVHLNKRGKEVFGDMVNQTDRSDSSVVPFIPARVPQRPDKCGLYRWENFQGSSRGRHTASEAAGTTHYIIGVVAAGLTRDKGLGDVNGGSERSRKNVGLWDVELWGV
ncbi:hypothetical protein Pcinc_038433 [Petrolisthes cinctipes]|uniref:SGNH hydrolase-type esterase domain-containing protein n=1 Tax=Petrolisthes cinctipes TaxID=88211 RepID=A0AAE1BQT2_PETCI|nr:hypothetical protein Pcinc_038433 [Petrolisthes cinctipes]